MNEFFSKFETLQYSLNLADNSYTDFGSIVEGEDFQYYKKREEMNSKRLELGDKLKSVILIKALGVDATYKRDILSKINFDKNPSEVYNDTKTAIRDICGKLKAQNCDNGGSEHTEVNIVKPWQDRGRSPYQNKGREIRDRKEGYQYRSGSFRGGNRSFSRERSSSRGRDSRRPTVSFKQRKSGGHRDVTPAAGTVTDLSSLHDKIFMNNSVKTSGSTIIVDCGCPRSLMGRNKYEKILQK